MNVFKLSWNAPVNADGSAVTGVTYKIYTSHVSNSYSAVAASTTDTNYTITLAAGNWYIVVVATTTGGDSAFSNEVHVVSSTNPPPPTNLTAT